MVSHDFKLYVSKLVKDLTDVEKELQHIIFFSKDEKQAIEKKFPHILDIIYNTNNEAKEVEEKIKDILDWSLYNLEKLTNNLTVKEHILYKEYFREKVNHISMQAPIVNRGLTKPLGYAGDFETMRMCYDNNYEGKTNLGKIMHKHFVDTHSVAVAVRNRRILIPKLIKDSNTFNILSVACGPAYEAIDILNENSSYILSLLDQDKTALTAAKEKISKYFNAFERTKYININIRSLFKDPINIGKYDFIYSMGLFDYLNDKSALLLCKSLFSILNPGGVLVIGNLSTKTPLKDRLMMEYWMEWPLIYRSDTQMATLVPNGVLYNTFYEESGNQVFLRLIKDKIKSKL